MKLSPKQQQLFNLKAIPNKHVIAYGPVRSGKTMAGLHGFLNWAGQHYSDFDFALAARSQRQWNAVIKREMQNFALNLRLPLRKGAGGDHYTLPNAHGGINRFWQTLGSDTSSVERIMGMTLAGAYLDEYVLMPEEFVAQFSARTSVPGGKIVMVTNPEGPLHWGKTEYLDRLEAVDGVAFQFTMDDNPSLSEDYKRQLAAQYTGSMYKRMVLGEWASTSGAVYPHVMDAIRKPPDERPDERYVAIDVGSVNPTHALLIEVYGDIQYSVKEWVWDGLEYGQLTDRQQIARMLPALVGDLTIQQFTVDPAANAFSLELASQARGVPVVDADNSVVEGCDYVRMLMDNRLLYIDPACGELIRQMANYQWDETAGKKGERKPVKEDDHGPDSLRYGVYTRAMQLSAGSVRVYPRRR